MSQQVDERGPRRDQLRPRVVSIPEAAKYIGRSRSHIYDLLHAGTVRAIKSGKRTLPILDDLDKYLDSLPIAEGLRPAHSEKFSKEPA